MDKTGMIKQSLRCLKFGWLALIPLAGVFCAIYALVLYGRVFVLTRDEWNPARNHLYAGAALALTSLLAHSLFISTVIWSAAI